MFPLSFSFDLSPFLFHLLQPNSRQQDINNKEVADTLSSLRTKITALEKEEGIQLCAFFTFQDLRLDKHLSFFEDKSY
jgi:hypothetical protein